MSDLKKTQSFRHFREPHLSARRLPWKFILSVIAIYAIVAVYGEYKDEHTSAHLGCDFSFRAIASDLIITNSIQRSANSCLDSFVGYPRGCAAPGQVPCQCNTQGFLSKLKKTPPQTKINVTSKTPVGVISVVTLIRTDTTLDHSQKAEKVWFHIPLHLCWF